MSDLWPESLWKRDSEPGTVMALEGDAHEADPVPHRPPGAPPGSVRPGPGVLRGERLRRRLRPALLRPDAPRPERAGPVAHGPRDAARGRPRRHRPRAGDRVVDPRSGAAPRAGGVAAGRGAERRAPRLDLQRGVRAGARRAPRRPRVHHALEGGGASGPGASR